MKQFDIYDRDWPSIVDRSCTVEMLLELEEMIKHVVVNHSDRFWSDSMLASEVQGLLINGTFVELGENDYETNPYEIHALAEIVDCWNGQNEFWRDSITYIVCGGDMRIVGLRYAVGGNELLLDWQRKDNSVIQTDLRFLMFVRIGRDDEGFVSASDLLSTLRQWDALADVFDECETREDWLTNTLHLHFEIEGEIKHHDGPEMTIVPGCNPDISFSVVPMWSQRSKFSSRTELAMYMKLPKPEIMKLHGTFPLVLKGFPIGNNDCVIKYDEEGLGWALMYSPRLGIYYKVTLLQEKVPVSQ